MRSFLHRILGAAAASKDDAKQRLKVLLIHDQIDLSPAQMERMRDEIMEVVSRYVEVDADSMDFRLTREEGGVALVSNFPVRRVTARVAS